jgi:hypothetical protein
MASRGVVFQEHAGVVNSAIYEAIPLVLFLLLAVAPTRSQIDARTHKQEPVFRAPFVLKLRIDKEHYYEQSFDRVPYVAENEVYLFAGETFGINLTVTENQLSRITYERDPAKADVALAFTQEESERGLRMLLVIQNRLKRRLSYDALMTRPEKKEIYKTSVLPVEPSLSNFEEWPHPIVQLVLKNFRFSEDGAKQSER